MFQSTHPRRVWRILAFFISYAALFQSTHPRRVWPLQQRHFRPWESFNPHTHAGCDCDMECDRISYLKFQSTHPRRVWLDVLPLFLRNWWFQSTHPRRVWLIFSLLCIILFSFNPHTHAGCDHSPVDALSTHTRFNPHTHAGCDNNRSNVSLLYIWFQSTHPRRVWLYI